MDLQIFKKNGGLADKYVLLKNRFYDKLKPKLSVFVIPYGVTGLEYFLKRIT